MTGIETALAIAGTVATVAGAGVSYMSSQASASAASKQAEYNAQVAKNNQAIADQAAKDAVTKAQVSQQTKADQTNALLGRQKVALAANGVEVNTGSAVDLQSDTKAAGTLDELTIQNNAAREAAGYTNQSTNYATTAAADEAASADALSSGNLKGEASLLSASSQVASQWYNYTSGTKSSSLSGSY